MFQSLYDSPWHSPALFWLLGAALLLVVLRRLPFLPAFTVLFLVVVFCDVLVTGALSPLGASPWGGRLAIAFVLLGDLRFFLLYERYRRRDDGGPGLPVGAALRAGALTLAVPLLANAPRLFIAGVYAEPRRLFLVYELLFFALALALRLGLWPRALRTAAPDLRRWLLSLASFEVAQYGAWAAADVLILAGLDGGFLLRLFPNVLYYGAFLPFAYLRAPARLRGAS